MPSTFDYSNEVNIDVDDENKTRSIRFYFGVFFLLRLYVSNPVICKWPGNNCISGSAYGVQRAEKTDEKKQRTQQTVPLTGS